ncbi:MAG: 30S ribosomal protein S6 [Clostridia bacterium]|nr:30S ribosomal protein S6 [Clostridia bacterium]
MANYEVLYILSPALSEEERESVIDKFKKFVEERDGVVGGIDKWGMRTLTYAIKFKKEGFYVLMNFKSPAETSIDMGKLMLINESILRHIIIKK